ncbi:DNA repair protein Rad50 [Phyllosticta citricarpa]|uniref:DNA repair protein Rad50 n=1 Tax=Phyllosticta citricarpa TaxID=55181 RepID=A0ABR1L7H4_9PEZI
MVTSRPSMRPAWSMAKDMAGMLGGAPAILRASCQRREVLVMSGTRVRSTSPAAPPFWYMVGASRGWGASCKFWRSGENGSRGEETVVRRLVGRATPTARGDVDGHEGSARQMDARWAYIDKLSILGVRSFDNRVSETIQFYSPLTLIVGFNGSGKTTIIECLKYATIGELPTGCDRGKSFIHDPNLCGEKDVLAQVKISFKATSGAKMVATRSLQLSIKKSGKNFIRTVKALEGQLLMIKDGERTAISSRVAELNQILPQYLGISAAILEYVVFCHQDESLWPMSEPGALKKRFDEIFDALKWTKAIDNIKLLIKNKKEELGKLKILEEHAKEDKDKGTRIEKRSQELYNEIEELRAQVEELASKKEEAAKKTTAAFDRSATFESIVSTLGGKRIQVRTLEENVRELRQNIQEMLETDAELQASLDRFEERVALYEDDKERQMTKYHKVLEGLKENRSTVGIKQAEHGKYVAEKEQHHREIESRENMIKATARRHNIRGFDLEITDEHAREFMERLQRMARDQQTTLDRVRRQIQEDLQKAQSAIGQLNERKSQIQRNEQKLSQLEADLDRIDVDEGRKATLESAIEETESRLKKIKDLNRQIREREEQRDNLEAEIADATLRARDSAKFDLTLTGAHGDRLSDVLGRRWEPRTLEAEFQAVLTQKSNDVQDAEKQRDGSNRELDGVKQNLTAVKADLKKKKVSIKDAEDRVANALDGKPIEDFPDELQEVESAVTVLQTDLSNFGAMKDYYTACLDALDKQNKCLLCERRYERQDPGISPFRKKLDQKLKETKEELKSLRGLQPVYDTWIRLKRTEVPELETTCRTLDARDMTLDDRLELKKDVESMSKTVQNIIKELEVKQTQTGTLRGLETIQDDLQQNSESTRALRSALANQTSEKDRLRDAKSKLSTAEYQLKEKSSLQGQIQDVKNQNAGHKDSMRKTDQEIQSLAPQLEQAQAKYDDEQSNKLHNSVNELALASKAIDACIARGGPNQVARAKAELEGLEEESQRDIRKIEDQLRNHQETKRAINENIRFRNATRQLESVRAEVSELEAHNAEWQEERNRLSAEEANVMGILKTKDDQLQQLIADWETDYKDAASKYKEAHIKHETTKAARDDLTTYQSALDKAIVKFHSIKLEEINRIIEELWKKTYQGTDVDTIMIKSESETTKSRSYNYRVVMVKQDAEMDMRGRCSAGQKVLASIIIRLALAECFGVSCGLIALDEPTTNLDRDNIRALAESLSEIIRVRRQQSNFQLIVITHDEEFLRYMNCGDFCDYYYRVSRNEKQKSIIEKQSIAEVRP